MRTWLTVAALSKRLGRAESTIRLWRDTYDVPQQIDADGFQTYPLDIYEAIMAMRAENLTPREISARLERRHGDEDEPAPAVDFEAAVLDRLDRLIAAVKRIADHLDREDP